MLFVPPLAGPWEACVAAALRNTTQRPRVVIGVDALYEPIPVPLWRRATLLPAMDAVDKYYKATGPPPVERKRAKMAT